MHLDFALRYNILQMYRLDHWSSRAVRAGKGLEEQGELNHKLNDI